uniref:DUF1640 domain-containing protein n=1 Tax=Candidatus Kentrum sp. DK TaxID=2126562 RepID=A0A450TD47_9GAMM|nr:MAG: hypothetical protein BECKDK2373C_GA0170839_100285 [Candidatus Kentron sp. DK]VFJ64892.1 MAG: hypothetical protein BECKDK2373B_GA0170837_11422 [Candidatus Kentron sp. DK]
MSTANTNQQPAAFQQPEGRLLTLEEISEHVRAHIGQWLAEQSLARPPQVYEVELRERMIRLEEELKSQRDLMRQGFDLMGKRFEAMSEENNRRFEAVDKRFEAMSKENNRRFEAVIQESNRRFDDVNKRFEIMAQDNREHVSMLIKRMDRLIPWSFGIALGTGSLIVAALKLLP